MDWLGDDHLGGDTWFRSIFPRKRILLTTHTGGIFDVINNTWELTSAPRAKGSHTAIWTGYKMIIWGGGSLQKYYYDL
jgi:hypothetical protein